MMLATLRKNVIVTSAAPMKNLPLLALLPLLAITACSTTKSAPEKKDAPETVMVIYHVKAGAESEFLPVLARAWEIYRKERLVFAEPHVIIRETESGGQSRIVEIFTWVSHEAPAHAPQSVKDIWEKEHTFCENRNGRNGIEGGEVELMLPAPR